VLKTNRRRSHGNISRPPPKKPTIVMTYTYIIFKTDYFSAYNKNNQYVWFRIPFLCTRSCPIQLSWNIQTLSENETKRNIKSIKNIKKTVTCITHDDVLPSCCVFFRFTFYIFCVRPFTAWVRWIPCAIPCANIGQKYIFIYTKRKHVYLYIFYQSRTSKIFRTSII